jgi:mRNA interferase MazF
MFGEIYLCEFPLTSGAPGKIRPALLLFDLGPDALIARVTSVPRGGPLDVTLQEWQVAGLLRPSVARLDRLVTAERSVFRRRLGVLSTRDADAVRECWKGRPRPARLRRRCQGKGRSRAIAASQ